MISFILRVGVEAGHTPSRIDKKLVQEAIQEVEIIKDKNPIKGVLLKRPIIRGTHPVTHSTKVYPLKDGRKGN